MSAFVLKIIALVSMACDHTSYLLFGRFSFLNCIGRIAFPIFAFQISEGYMHTNNLKKYMLRLFAFALISQVPFILFRSVFTSGFALNVFFTLFFGLLSIVIYDTLNKINTKNRYTHYLLSFIGIFSVIAIAIIAELMNTDYGAFGIAIIFVFYLFKDKKFLMNIGFTFCCIFYYLKNLLYSSNSNIYLTILVFTLIPLIFINLYNNKKGKNTKYFLYIFYPVHFLIIYLLSFLPIFPIS